MRDFFRTLKRLHFWLLCPLIIGLGLVGWWMATSKIQAQTKSRVSNIESHFRDVQSISSKALHPNDQVHEGMKSLIEKRRDEVAEAWTEKYEQQVRGNVMTWEFDSWPDDIEDRFVKRVIDLRPIEKTVKFPPEREPLIITLRHRYRDYIENELPRLAKTIRAEWRPSANQRGGRLNYGDDFEGGRPSELGGNRTDEQAVQTIVDWNPANQQELLDTHFSWKDGMGGGFGPMGPRAGGQTSTDERPTTLDILYAQEDFWVLQAIMNVIKRTNVDPNDPTKPVTTSVNATVKEIDFIRIGASASRPQGHVKTAESLDAGMGATRFQEGAGQSMEYEMPPMMPEGGEEMGMGGPTGPDPAEGRYVDKNYQALPAEKLRAVMASEEAVSPEDVYLVVAKRMPVRMRLKVDQRRLNRLLQECASSELTIEVRQVRINQEEAGGSQGLPGVRSPRGTDLDDARDDAFSYDIDVELYGIIYIYNPVDRKTLGYEDVPTEGETEPVDGDLAAS